MKKPWKNDVYWLAFLDLLSLPRNGTAHTGLGHPTSIIDRENAPQMCPWANLMKGIPKLRFRLPK